MKPANNAPIYACVYQGFAEVAREHGYALAVHGSMARDFDLIAIPWTDEAKEPSEVVDAITRKYAVRKLDGDPALKPHGRLVWTIVFQWGDVALDLGFMPRTPC